MYITSFFFDLTKNLLSKFWCHSTVKFSNLLVILTFAYPSHGCTLWVNYYNAPLTKVVKLQNKAIGIINVPLLEPTTPHYAHLGFLKSP